MLLAGNDYEKISDPRNARLTCQNGVLREPCKTIICATVDLVPYTKHAEITLAPSRLQTHPFPTPLHPIPKSITINKIRGYSKVSNQGNQCCFQTCTVHEQRAGLIFVCGLITCFCILMEGGDCALSPISEDKGLANYFVWMLMIGFH